MKRDRPYAVPNKTYRVQSPVGNCFVTISGNGRDPFEVFINVGKCGSDVAAIAEGYGRLLSWIFRTLPEDKDPKEVAAELAGYLGEIGSDSQWEARSLPDAVAIALKTHIGGDNGTGHLVS